MAEYALVDAGVVKTVIIADDNFIVASGDIAKSQCGFPGGEWVLTPSKVGMGWSYDGVVFAAPEMPQE